MRSSLAETTVRDTRADGRGGKRPGCWRALPFGSSLKSTWIIQEYLVYSMGLGWVSAWPMRIKVNVYLCQAWGYRLYKPFCLESTQEPYQALLWWLAPLKGLGNGLKEVREPGFDDSFMLEVPVIEPRAVSFCSDWFGSHAKHVNGWDSGLSTCWMISHLRRLQI